MAEHRVPSWTSETDDYLLAVGTYTRPMPHVHGIGRGIHLLRFDGATASLRDLRVQSHGVNPSYLCHSTRDGLLYSVNEQDAGASIDVYALGRDDSLRHLRKVSTPGASPCHISLNLAANHLYVSNYGSGELLCYQLDQQGLPASAPTIIVRHGSSLRRDRQTGPHVHCALPSPTGDGVYFCDLGTDTIARHPVRNSTLDLTPDLLIQAEPGSGPRHLLLDRTGARAFVLNELSNSVTTLRLPARGDTRVQTLARVRTLPAAWLGPNTASALCLDPDGRWLYATNRGHDSIMGFRVLDQAPWLDPIGWWPAGGRTPRDAAITPDGAFLFVTCQDDHRISCFRIDSGNGQLLPAGTPFAISSPACILPLLQ